MFPTRNTIKLYLPQLYLLLILLFRYMNRFCLTVIISGTVSFTIADFIQ